MTKKDKILNKHLTDNGFEEYVNYGSAFWQTITDAMEEYKQLHIPDVSQQRELFNAILDFSEDLPMCTEDYHRSELWEKYKALNCG